MPPDALRALVDDPSGLANEETVLRVVQAGRFTGRDIHSNAFEDQRLEVAQSYGLLDHCASVAVKASGRPRAAMCRTSWGFSARAPVSLKSPLLPCATSRTPTTSPSLRDSCLILVKVPRGTRSSSVLRAAKDPRARTRRSAKLLPGSGTPETRHGRRGSSTSMSVRGGRVAVVLRRRGCAEAALEFLDLGVDVRPARVVVR